MNTIEVMRQALEALEAYSPMPVEGSWFKRHHNAITNLRAAIEQMEKQEPVAWGYISEDPYDSGDVILTTLKPNRKRYWPLYAAPHPAPAVEKAEPVIDPNCRCDEHGACAYCWNGKKHDPAPAVPEKQEPDKTKIEMVIGAIHEHMSIPLYPREVAAAAQYIVHRYCSHPTPAVPTGWKLVPIKPTPEQKDDMREAANQYVVKRGRYDNGMIDELYKAMLAAAPEYKEQV